MKPSILTFIGLLMFCLAVSATHAGESPDGAWVLRLESPFVKDQPRWIPLRIDLEIADGKPVQAVARAIHFNLAWHPVDVSGLRLTDGRLTGSLAVTFQDQEKAGGCQVPLPVVAGLPAQVMTVDIPLGTITTAYYLGDAYQLPGGGPALAVKTVEQFIGVPINYYAQIDFAAFVRFIDEIGGVKIDVPAPITVDLLGTGAKTKKKLKPGVQVLPGEWALAYARNRYTENGDFDRAARQQQVIMGIRDQVLQVKTLPKLVGKAPALYQDLASGIRTNLTLDDVIQLAVLTQSVPVEGIKRGIIHKDTVFFGETPDGQSILIPIPDDIQNLRDDIFATSGAIGPQVPGSPQEQMKTEAARLAVYDGNGDPSLGGRAVEYLRGQGANITQTGAADRGYSGTTIIDHTGNPYIVKYLVELLRPATISEVELRGNRQVHRRDMLGREGSSDPGPGRVEAAVGRGNLRRGETHVLAVHVPPETVRVSGLARPDRQSGRAHAGETCGGSDNPARDGDHLRSRDRSVHQGRPPVCSAYCPAMYGRRERGDVSAMHTHWRSRDLFNAAADNIIAMTFWQREWADALSAMMGRKVRVGRYKDFADSLHIYGQVLENVDVEKLADKIFDRFYQVDASQTREQEGSGIGLALVKELVELHHGTIQVASEVGKGTTFTIRLPLGRSHLKDNEVVELPVIAEPTAREMEGALVDGDAEGPPDPAEGRQSEQEKPIVLVIEDNVDVRAYITEYLVPAYNVTEARDGAEGVEKALEGVPDLIISDVMMPKKDGYEVCRTLKLDQRTSHIPIILLTAKAASENKIEGLETGADDYLIKPFDPKELLARARNLIEVRPRLRERFDVAIPLKPGEIAITSMDDAFLKKVMAVVEQRMGNEKFSVEELGQEVGMSRSQLHRKLTALTSQSPSDFVRYMRLHRAMALLQGNAGTVAEVAYSVGFGDPSHFSKRFHEVFGVTPGEVRKNPTN